MATLGLIIVAGAALHVVAGAAALRRASGLAALGSLIGALLVAGGAVAALSQGARVADAREAALWALGASMVMFAAHGSGTRATSRHPALALSLVGFGAALVSGWLMQLPPRVAVEATALTATAWTAAHATCVAGGAAFALLGLLVASQDARLRHVSWLGLGVAMATLGASALVGSGGPGGLVSFVLSDARGVPIEIRADLLRAAGQAEPLGLTAVVTSELLTRVVMTATGLAAAAGLLGSLHRTAGRVVFALAALAALYGAVLALGASGVVQPPSGADLVAQLASAGVRPELLAAAPSLAAHQGAAQIHAAAVVPLAMVLWIVAMVCGMRALAPSVAPATAVAQRSFAVGATLAAARDALLLATVLLWLALALGLFATMASLERFVADHRVAAQAALPVLALATVTGWHTALRHASRASFAMWTAVLALVVAVVAVVLVSGVLTGEAFTLLAPTLRP